MFQIMLEYCIINLNIPLVQAAVVYFAIIFTTLKRNFHFVHKPLENDNSKYQSS